MRISWLFLGILVVLGLSYAVAQFWHPSLIDTIFGLFIILAWMLSQHEQKMNERLDRLEAELTKGLEQQVEGSPHSLRDTFLESAAEQSTRLDDGLVNLGRHIEWKVDSLGIDLENRTKRLEWQIQNSSNDLTQIIERLATLESSFQHLGWQIECLRQLQQISDFTRELRARVTIGESGEGESIKGESLRSSTVSLLGYIQEDMNEFVLPFREDLLQLSLRLRGVLKTLQETALASPTRSIDEIHEEARRITEELDEANRSDQRIEDEEMAKLVDELRQEKERGGR